MDIRTTLIIIIMIGMVRISKPVKALGYKARSYPTKYTLLLPEISFVPAIASERATGCYYAITGVISVTLLLDTLVPLFRARDWARNNLCPPFFSHPIPIVKYIFINRYLHANMEINIHAWYKHFTVPFSLTMYSQRKLPFIDPLFRSHKV